MVPCRETKCECLLPRSFLNAAARSRHVTLIRAEADMSGFAARTVGQRARWIFSAAVLRSHKALN